MKRLLALVGLSALIAVLGVFAAVALAYQDDPANHKVMICHASASVTNPYQTPDVDKDSIKNTEGLVANGHGTHVGPIFDPATNTNGDNWGDIIPPFSAGYLAGPPEKAWGAFPGLNWTEEGQAIWENGCEPVTPPPLPEEDVFAASAVCDIENEEYDVSGTVNGDVAQVKPKTIAGDFVGETTVDVKLGEVQGHATVITDGKCVGTPPPPPHEVTGGASVACILPDGYYRVSGTVDGHAADDVDPATIPGNTKGNTEVRVTRGDTSVTTTVSTNGDCGNAPTPPVVPPPAVETTTPTTPTTPTAPLTPPTTKPVAKKPALKKPAAKPAPPKQAVAGAVDQEKPTLAYTP